MVTAEKARYYGRAVVLDEHLAGTDSLVALEAAHRAAWNAVDPALLSLCRNRMAMLRRHQPTLVAMSAPDLDRLKRWPTAQEFGDIDRAALDFTEQYLIDVASLSDVQVERLGGHLGDEGLVDFVNALLVVEQRMSLELFFGLVF